METEAKGGGTVNHRHRCTNSVNDGLTAI